MSLLSLGNETNVYSFIFFSISPLTTNINKMLGQCTYPYLESDNDFVTRRLPVLW